MIQQAKILLLLPLFVITTIGFAQEDEPSDFEIYKNLELFELVYKTIDMSYVDESNPGHLMKVAIDAMLHELDPYTNYIPESLIEDYKLMTQGQYGGIGALIQQQGDKVVVSDPKVGLMAGDQFIEISGQNVEELSSSEISDKLKGKPGSELTIVVDRNGEKLSKTITREEIKLSPVPHSEMINEDVGYIKLTSFTKTAAADVLTEFELLKKSGMTKLILDLRGNPGGLLVEAVKIVNFFVSKGQEIVSMKGRGTYNDHTYSASLKPVDLNIPVAVLVDGNSASASEIVSGALQDLDRAVVVGQTSFGKGLVQRPLDLKYNAKIKVTIAKYYTPSGRCIQKLDYSNRVLGDDAEAISDSLISTFKTRNGRIVNDGRGVEPEIKIAPKEYSNLTKTIVLNNIIFNYATQFRIANSEIASPKEFKFTDANFQDFVDFVLKQEFEYTTASANMMNKLKETAEDEDSFKEVEAEYNELLAKLAPSKERDLQKFKSELIELLEDEIIGRYYYQKGRISHSLIADPFIEESIKILNDSPRYKSILNIQ
jgi:carboxyl-terminal processing protease